MRCLSSMGLLASSTHPGSSLAIIAISLLDLAYNSSVIFFVSTNPTC